ncbi:hypothetical protein RhiirA4_499930 [Rhizophagus irregularis]|uniref:Uncharacterized protein n=1 Tax=Rhizophagus irregularis TaxID=588596 RepID=A0A2I1H4X3_9GLOM|nr:hypothetical protein RhiirA4_499930 [Rhizophagus irregularis]
MHVPKLSFGIYLNLKGFGEFRAALGQGFPPNINYYFDIEEEPAKLQRLEKETNTKEQEKENSNVENESHDISKKKFATKRKATDDAEIWQNHEIDLLLQYIEDNFDEYRKGNKNSIAVAISTMSELRERVWDKKIELEREKMEKSHEVEMKRLEVEQQKWKFVMEKIKMKYELKWNLRIKIDLYIYFLI